MAQPTKAEQKIIDAAVKRLKKCVDADNHNRQAATEDLRFCAGDQWDSGEKKRRSDRGRPALVTNLLPKYIDQVVGDMLHNQPQIKVRPVDSRADINIAKIRQGIIQGIEYQSNSKSIYHYGTKQMVTCGYGAWRVLTRYTEENPFLQEAYLESVRNPFLIYLDPAAKDQFGSDAKYGFVLEKMSKDEFKERYPKGVYPSSELKTGSGLSYEHWYDGDTVTVAEYFTVEEETVEMLQLEDGRVVDAEGFKELMQEWQEKNQKLLQQVEQMQPPQGQAPPQAPNMPPQQGQAPTQAPMGQPNPAPQSMAGGTPSSPQVPASLLQAGPNPLMLAQQAMKLGAEPKVAKRRETKKQVVKQRILTCCEILEGGADGNVFPGSYIPLVLLKGKELNIEGKNHVYSLIRNAKDQQKLINFWQTAAAETIALAPKSPWLGTARQFEGYEEDYASANVDNIPFLKYNVDPEAPAPPMRQQPTNPPIAIFQQIQRGEDNLKSVIGMFGADMGEQGPERTGAAIVARQRPGDIGTFEFMHNLSQAIAHTGRILNSIIPHIYDSERDVRLRGIDDTETFMPVNTTLGQAHKAITSSPEVYTGVDAERIKGMIVREGKDARFNDITVGKYDVMVSVGPSYATQRQESAQHLLQLMQTAPQQMSTGLDLVVRNLDFKDSDELEKRLRKPLLMAGVVKPKPGEELPPPQPPNPAVVQAQAKLAAEQNKAQMLQVKVMQEQIKLKERELALKEKEVQLQIAMAKAFEATGQRPTITPSDQLRASELDRKYELEGRRLNLEEARFAHQSGMDMHKHDHERVRDYEKLDIERSKAVKQPKGS